MAQAHQQALARCRAASQPFQLLSGLDVLGNASSALGNLSKGVAALSMDSKFIRSRQTQVRFRAEDSGFRV